MKFYAQIENQKLAGPSLGPRSLGKVLIQVDHCLISSTTVELNDEDQAILHDMCRSQYVIVHHCVS